MNCEKCGAKLEENDRFCPICGAQVPNQNQYQNNEGMSNQNQYQNNGNVPNQNQNNGGMANENAGFSYERPTNQPMYNNVQQPNNQPNQNYGQPVGEARAKNPNGKNSGNTVKAVVITIIVMTVLVTLALLIYTLISANKEDNKNNKGKIEEKNSAQNVTNTNRNDNKETNTNDIDDDYNNYYSNTNRGNTTSNTNSNTTSNGNSNTTPNNKKPTSTYTVNTGGFELYVPDDLLYELDSAGNMIVTNMDDTWIVQMAMQELSYQEIKKNSNKLKSLAMEQFSSFSPTISEAKIETINGVEYIFVEITMQGETMILAFAQLNSKYVATIIATSEEDFDREPLREIAPIISTASYTGNTSNINSNSDSNIGNTSNIKTDFDINMNDIKKIYED